MQLQSLPFAMTPANLRRVIDQFRALKPAASISIKPDSVQVLDPRGALVFTARKSGDLWTASARPGLLSVSFC